MGTSSKWVLGHKTRLRSSQICWTSLSIEVSQSFCSRPKFLSMASLVSPSLCDPILVLKTFLDTIYNMTGDVPLKHLETYIIDTGTSCASWNLMEPHGTSLHFQAVSFSGPMVVGSSFSRQLSLNHVSRNNSKTIIFKRCQKHTHNQPSFFETHFPAFPVLAQLGGLVGIAIGADGPTG